MVEISVIMPVYNTEDYLEESINCILNQTFKDLELICVDDGSTDESLNILNKIANKDNRVKVFHQENKGGGAARNYALTKATGKYLYFMDSDDILKENALQEFYNIAEEKNLDFLIFQAINYDDETKEYYTTDLYCMNEIADIVGEKVFNYKDLGEKIFEISVTPWCKFYNREFVNKSGAQFAEGLIFHDNIFFWPILFSAKRIYFYKKCLYIRRRHKSSSTGAGDKRFVSTIKIHNLMTKIFIEFNEFERFKEKLYNRKVSLIYFRLNTIQEIYKDFLFSEMKKDFKKITTHERYDEFLDSLEERNKVIFESVLVYNTGKKAEARVQQYMLNKEKENRIKSENEFLRKENQEVKDANQDLIKQNENLKNKNLKLKTKNKKLKTKNKKLKYKQEEIFNSNSWKITKPLRKIGSIRR